MLARALLLLLLSPLANAQTFPGDWDGYATHSVTTEPASNLTDFDYKVSLNQMPASWWSAVKSDGGDIRASKNADGTGRMAVDLIEFDHSTDTGMIVVGWSGTKSSSASEPIYVWAGCPSATLPAVDSEFGGQNAYASHVRAFYPSGGGNDRTSYANNLTMTGSPTVGGEAGPINGSKATDYNGSSQYGTATASVPAAAPATIIAMGRPDNVTNEFGALSVSDISKSNVYVMQMWKGTASGDPIAAQIADVVGSNANSSSGFSASTWSQGLALFTSSTSRQGGINGAYGTAETANRTPANLDTIAVAVLRRSSGNATYFDGRLSLVSLHDAALSTAWVAYHDAMIDPADPDQSDFYGTWSWTATGGPLPTVSPSNRIYRLLLNQ